MKPSIVIAVTVLVLVAFSNKASAFPSAGSNILGKHNSSSSLHNLAEARPPSIVQRQRRSTASVQARMGGQGAVYGAAVAATFGMQAFGFAAAYLLKTEKFYDVFGGLNYLLLAALSAGLGAAGDGGALPWVDDPRKVLATVLFASSRAWLLLFLAWRAHARKGDARFDEVLGKGGGPPQPLWFLVYWMVQAMWVLLVSMPMLFVNSSSVRKPGFSGYDVVFAVLFGGGVLTEIVADIQKALWVKRGRQGDFCETGLWKYSRHPNYFGEIFQFWCLFAFSYSSSNNSLGGYADPLWWAGIISPLFTMHILLNMQPTGISNAEGKNLKRYYDKCPGRYAKYRENTSILIPFIGYGRIPEFLKRTLFLDFERYEYRPPSGEQISKKDE